MQTKFIKSLATAAVIAAAFGAQSSYAGQRVITIDGSSTVYPITEAVAEEFQNETNTRVTVGISGTGGGFKKFCRGEIDISDASRPIKQKEIDKCKAAGIQFIEIPVAFDALTVVINPKNDFAKTMTVAELKKIWEPAAQGKLKTWKSINTEDAKYIGLIEFQSDDGEFHNFEILETKNHLVFGGACNIGFLESGNMEKDSCFSLDENLQEMLGDLEVYYNDGPHYVSSIVCNERM